MNFIFVNYYGRDQPKHTQPGFINKLDQERNALQFQVVQVLLPAYFIETGDNLKFQNLLISHT
jgi:hypothetical protein